MGISDNKDAGADAGGELGATHETEKSVGLSHDSGLGAGGMNDPMERPPGWGSKEHPVHASSVDDGDPDPDSMDGRNGVSYPSWVTDGV